MSQIPSSQPPSSTSPTPAVASPISYSMPATQTGNGMAVASLVSSLVLFCAPYVGAVAGILLGILGLRRSKATGKGQGLSIAGIIIGALSLFPSIFFWTPMLLALVGMGAALKISDASRAATQQFIKDVSAGNLTAAAAETDGSIPQIELQSLSDAVKDLGALKDVTNKSINLNNNQFDLKGTATYDKGQKAYTIHLHKVGDGWKVSSMTFDQ